MMTVQTINFQGRLIPAVPVAYTVRCATCRAVVMQGEDAVNTTGLTHDCFDTASRQPEFEIVWDTVDPVEA